MKNKFLVDAISALNDSSSFTSFDRDREMVSRIRRTVKNSSQSFFADDGGIKSTYRGILVIRLTTQTGRSNRVIHSVFSIVAWDKSPVVDAQTLIDTLREDKVFAPQVDQWAESLTEEVAKNLFVKYCFTKARANTTMGIIASAFMDREHPLVIIDVTSSMTRNTLPIVQSITAIPLNEARQWVGLPPLPSKSDQESLTLPKTSYPNRKVPDTLKLSVSPTKKHNLRKKAKDAMERSKKSDSAIPPADPSGEEIDQLAMEVATAPLKASAEKTLSKTRKKKCDKADTSISPTSKSAGTVKEIPLTPERCLQVQNDVNDRRRAHLKNEQEALKAIGEKTGPLVSAGTLITTLLNLKRENEAVAEYLAFCFSNSKTK